MPTVTIAWPWLILGALAIGVVGYTLGHFVGHKVGKLDTLREKPDLS